MTISIEKVKDLSNSGNIIPIYREFLADSETPITALLKIKNKPNVFLLESAEGGHLGRYTFLGHSPYLTFKAKDENYTLSGEYNESGSSSPLSRLKELFAQYKGVQYEGLPSFCGGSVGYICYDAIRMVENIPASGVDELNLPDIYFGFFDSFIVFDNLKHKIMLLSNVRLDLTSDIQEAYDKALSNLDTLEKDLSGTADTQIHFKQKATPYTSNFSQTSFEDSVGKCKDYIKAGDAFQIVLSQRLSMELGCEAIDVYRSLRTINPSDYMYYFKFDETEVVGASPEALVKIDKDGHAMTRPIAGTRPRGKNQVEDLAFEKDLLSDEKELAEHLMLVDLGRNDLGKVSQIGTVSPTEFMKIGRYSNVMHIISTVEGRLKEGLDPLDALFSCFPAGTLSGAPKIRAMEIIDEMEQLQRGIYGGAICYRDFNGNLDSCIAIRTMVKQGKIAHIQAGAGIVADSNPTLEYEETLHKLGALLRAIADVESLRGIK